MMESLKNSMLETNGKMFLVPFSNAYSATVNTGFYHRAKVHRFLGFDVSAKVMFTSILDADKTFNFELSENQMDFDFSSALPGVVIDPVQLSFADLYYGEDTETATIFGSSGAALAPNRTHIEDRLRSQLIDQGINAQVVNQIDFSSFSGAVDTLHLPNGLDLPQFGLVVPQASIGLPLGFEATARGVKLNFAAENSDGSSTDVFLLMMGLGGRYSVSKTLSLPVDLAVGAFFQQVSLGQDSEELLSTVNSSYNLQVGKEFSPLWFRLGVYGDVAYEAGTVNISYTSQEFDTKIDFDFTTDPGLRYGAGFHLTLFPLTYLTGSFSKTETREIYSAGLGISLR
jgi:hypothetical protein